MNLKRTSLMRSACAVMGSILLVGSLAWSGCMSNKGEFRTSVHQYNNAIRWRDLDRALLFVQPDQQMTYFNNARRFFSSSRVTDVEVEHIVKKTDEDPDGNRYDVYVTIQYFNDASSTINKVQTQQRWTYSKENDSWLVESSSPVDVAENK